MKTTRLPLSGLICAISCLTTLCAGADQPASNSATAKLPFKVEVVEVEKSTMPPVHSYCSATAEGKWLILCGRIAGLHGFGPGKDNFPRSTANTMAYVVDPGSNKVLGSVDLVKSLPVQLAGPLTATNPEFVQVGGDLYVVGGYGKDLQAEGITTFGSITKIDVARLMKAILGQKPILGCFTQNPVPDNRLKVTGGALKAADGTFYLVFGQDFTGFYSVQNRDYNRAGGQFQKYTEKVRVFTLNADLSINTFTQIDGGYDQNLPYHRRDLNVVDIIQADGSTPAATIYGGVFRAGQVAGHTTPIDLTYSTTAPKVEIRAATKQGLNHYDCANVTIFDSASSSSFTTLFGGISQYHYDKTTNTLVQDQVNLAVGVDGLPFVDSISTIQHLPEPGSFAQFIHQNSLPGLLGTDSQFLVSPGLRSTNQLFPNGVVNLANLTGRTRVGHLVGGLESYGPYSAMVTKVPSTIANPRLFEVWITPEASSVIPMPAIPTMTTPYPPSN